MDEQKLNRKLAEWAAFTHGGNYGWDYPDGNWLGHLPWFIDSLDACFRWLVPKLEPLGYDLEIRNDLELKGWSVCLSNTRSECSIASPMERCQLEGITLALCLTIEKLIDGSQH